MMAPSPAAEASPRARVAVERRPSTLQLAILFLAAFALLVAWRRDILFDPPYFEFATGLFMEADFLAETNYDYHRLRYAEKYVAEGGPYAYMTSVLPTFIAWLMRSTSEPNRVFLYYHLFNIACASLALVSVYALIAAQIGSLLAGLCAAAVISSPIFSTQVDMLGMDLPMTAFAVLAASLLVNGRPWAASVASFLAFLMKPTGALVTLVIIAYLGLLILAWGWQRWRGGARELAWPRSALTALALAGLVLLLELAISRWGGINEKLIGIIPPDSSFLDVRLVCPDLVVFGFAALVASLPVLWRSLRRGEFATLASARPSAGLLASTLIVCWLMLGATTAAIVRYGYVSPRYFTLWVPFLFAVLGLVLASSPWRSGWSAVALAAIVGFNLVNWDGKFYPRPDDVTSWTRTENRCRAYLTDMRSTIAAVREIEKRAAYDPILAGHPFPYFLALPRMGYVQRPLHGYSVNAFENERFPNWAKALVDRPESLVVIWVKNYYYHHALARVPPPEPGDEIIYQSDDPSPLVVYRKRFSKLAWESGEADRWILENSWQDPTDRSKLGARPELLAAFGRPDLALRLLEPALAANSDNVTLRLKRCQLLAQAGRIVEARREIDTLLGEHPHDAEVLFRRGLLAEVTRDFELALGSYDAAIAANPNHTASRFRTALLSLERSDFKRADDELRACLRLQPNNAVYRNALGVSLARQGRLDLARREFDEVLRIAPGDRTAIENLGQLDKMPPQ
ncbi:MAG: tetratricopeptide repeat protein [Pirellulales bacterium]|nr:tetratricopeptide repeat protein [Pirellulales bacterium]